MGDKIRKSPNIRFAGFTDDWEERKFSDLYKKINEKNDLSFGMERIISVANMYYKNESNANSSEEYMKTYNIFRIGDIAFEGNKSKNYSYGRFVENDIGDGIISHVFDVFRPIVKYDLWFWKYMINNENVMAHVLRRVTTKATMMNNLVAKDFLKAKILVPKIEEQAKVGRCFKQLDNLITLHQRKLDLLKATKKSMLQKMFPKNGESVPEIRFAGFTGDWEERKFSEIFIYLKNNSLSRADLNYEKGVVKDIHYGDILINFGEILDVEKAEIPFISDNEFTVSKASLLQNGDVIIADAAEDEAVGKCSEIKGIDAISIVSGLHTIPCRPSKTFASGYLGYYMNSSAYHNQLLPLIQGTKISSISKSALQNTYVIYPQSEQEQKKIGEYFQNLDNLITLHQRKLDLLKDLKKSMLKQMFI